MFDPLISLVEKDGLRRQELEMRTRIHGGGEGVYIGIHVKRMR